MLKAALIVVVLSGSLPAQVGSVFPLIVGTALDERPAKVPQGNGKMSIVGIAFHRQAEDELKKWLNPLYQTFIKKEGTGGFDLADYHDVNFAFIPVIAGFRKIADEFKKGTDQEYWPYIIDTEKTGVRGIQEKLGVEDHKVPYFYALDASGKILTFVSGNFSEKKLAILESALGED